MTHINRNYYPIPGSQTQVQWVGTPQESAISGFTYAYSVAYPGPYTNDGGTTTSKVPSHIRILSDGTHVYNAVDTFQNQVLDMVGWRNPDSADEIGFIETVRIGARRALATYGTSLSAVLASIRVSQSQVYPFQECGCTNGSYVGGYDSYFANPPIQVSKPSAEVWSLTSVVYKLVNGSYSITPADGAVVCGLVANVDPGGSPSGYPAGSVSAWVFSSTIYSVVDKYRIGAVDATKYQVHEGVCADSRSVPADTLFRGRFDEGGIEVIGIIVGKNGSNLLYIHPNDYPSQDYDSEAAFRSRPINAFCMHPGGWSSSSKNSPLAAKYDYATDTTTYLHTDALAISRWDPIGGSISTRPQFTPDPVVVQLETVAFGTIFAQVNTGTPFAVGISALTGQTATGMRAEDFVSINGWNPIYYQVAAANLPMYGSKSGVPIVSLPVPDISVDSLDGYETFVAADVPMVYIPTNPATLFFRRITQCVSSWFVASLSGGDAFDIRLFALKWNSPASRWEWQSAGWIPCTPAAANPWLWVVNLKPYIDALYSEGDIGGIVVGKYGRFSTGGSYYAQANIMNQIATYSRFDPLPSPFDIPAMGLPQGNRSITVAGYAYSDTDKVRRPQFINSGSASESTVVSSGSQTTEQTLAITIKPYFQPDPSVDSQWLRRAGTLSTYVWVQILLIDTDANESWTSTPEVSKGWSPELQMVTNILKTSSSNTNTSPKYTSIHPRKNLHLAIQHVVTFDTILCGYSDTKSCCVVIVENLKSYDYGATWTHVGTNYPDTSWIDDL